MTQKIKNLRTPAVLLTPVKPMEVVKRRRAFVVIAGVVVSTALIAFTIWYKVSSSSTSFGKGDNIDFRPPDYPIINDSHSIRTFEKFSGKYFDLNAVEGSDVTTSSPKNCFFEDLEAALLVRDPSLINELYDAYQDFYRLKNSGSSSVDTFEDLLKDLVKNKLIMIYDSYLNDPSFSYDRPHLDMIFDDIKSKYTKLEAAIGEAVKMNGLVALGPIYQRFILLRKTILPRFR